MKEQQKDPYLAIDVIKKTENPAFVVYEAMHQDYSDSPVTEQNHNLTEEEYEQIIIKLLSPGHYGCFEHPSITINAKYYPHSLIQQIRTHRVGVSFDVQSFRYTGMHLYELGRLAVDYQDVSEQIEKAFYLRPIGSYTDRQGSKYHYDKSWRELDKQRLIDAVAYYYHDVSQGKSEEHARGLLPFDYRQHFVMSMNARSLMHILDLRWKADAQLEIQMFCDQLFEIFSQWMPLTAQWYLEKRGKKAKLAP